MTKTKIFSLIAFSLATIPSSAELIINEVMQSNVNTLFVDNDYPDSWLELYNPDAQDIDLGGGGYKISLTADPADGYALPEQSVIKANEYLLIYCDKEATGLHTDFRIDSGKGNVYLFDPTGKLVDSVKLAKMPSADVSYGRIGDTWAYFVKATPGAPNDGPTSSVLLPDPIFSLKAGIYDAPVTLTVSIPENVPEGTQLSVTTDGSLPTIPLTTNTFEIQLTSSTGIRARLLNENCLHALPAARSYIFLDRPTDLPVISITTGDDELYSEEKGILHGLKEDESPNYKQDWRRPVNIEYFSKQDHQPLFSQVGEVRVHGGQTRDSDQKSLAVYANKRFGTKRFDSSDFWDDKSEIKTVKSFLLRNGGNDLISAHMRDSFLQESMAEGFGNLDYQAYQPAIVYINGIYKGLYDIRERSNEDNIEANYDGLEDIDMFENMVVWKTGDPEAWKKLLYETNSDDCTYERLTELFNPHSMLANLATAMYANHEDFMPNNIVLWRAETIDNNRWRFLVKDLDISLGRFYAAPETNYFDFLDSKFDNESYYIRMVSSPYKVVVRTPEGQKALTRYILFLLGEIMQPQSAKAKFLEMESEIADEIMYTYQAWMNAYDTKYFYNNWLTESTEKGAVCRWIDGRPEALINHIAERFGFGTPYKLNILRDGCEAALYDLPLYRDEFHGFGMTGFGLDLAEVTGHSWLIEQRLSSGGLYISGPWKALNDYHAPEGTKELTLRLVEGEGSGIDELDVIDAPVSYFTLDGQSLGPVPPTAPGIYIKRAGSRTSKFAVQ